MTLATLARRRTWRTMPMWAVAAGVNTSVLLGVLYWRAATSETPVPTLSLVLASWVGVATWLAFTDVRTRCTAFDLSLPVPARKLWWNHLGSLLTGGLAIVALTMGVIVVHRSLPVGVHAGLGVGSLAAALAAGTVLAVLLLLLPRPSLARVPATPATVAWTAGVLIATPVALALAVAAGWWGLGAVALVAAGTGAWVRRRVPIAYVLAPLEAGAVPGPSASAVPVPVEGSAPSRMLLALTIVRCVSAGAKELLGMPMVLVCGVILGGGLLVFDEPVVREMRFLFLAMTTYMMFALVGPRLASLHHLDALPVSRRPLAAALVVPYVVLLCAGYGAGALLASDARSRLEYVDFEKGDEGYRVTVPLRVYDLARDGKARPVESPWGESREPSALPLCRWTRAAVYSPYGAPPGSSAEFVALQIHRAVEEVYGVSIAARTIQERYLRTLDDGTVVPRGEGLTLRRDYPGLFPVSGPMFPVLVSLGTVPWLLLVALLLRAYRAGIREWVRQTIVWGGLGALLLVWLGLWFASFDVLSPWALRAVVEIPVMRTGQTIAGTLAVWAVSLAAMAASYVLAQSQLVRMEIPIRPSQYTLLRLGRD